MPSPSKNKGSGWERDVAKHLTEIFGETFIRAPGSGAYIGGKNQARVEFLHEGTIRVFKGDIVPGVSYPKFNIECKFYKDFSFHQLLTDNKQFNAWTDQLLDVADEADFNILIMKFNRIGKYIAIHESSRPSLILNNFTQYKNHHGYWYITEYDSFWEANTDTVKQLVM